MPNTYQNTTQNTTTQEKPQGTPAGAPEQKPPEITGIQRAVPVLLLGLAAFLTLCFVLEGAGTGLAGGAIAGVLQGLFSWGAFFLPLLLAVHALFYYSDIRAHRRLSRVLFSVLVMLTVSSLAYIGHSDLAPGAASLYESGKHLIGGGVIGSGIAIGITRVLGPAGLIVISVMILALYITFFFPREKNIWVLLGLKILTGLAVAGAAVEKFFRKNHAAAQKKREERRHRAAREKQKGLLDDEFVMADNGLAELQISELGIRQVRSRESMEENPHLHDKVRHDSNNDNARPGASAAKDYATRADRRSSVNAGWDIGQPDLKSTAKKEEKPPVVTVIQDTPTVAADGTPILTDRADEVFTRNFDPYDIDLNTRMAGKPSSRATDLKKDGGVSEYADSLAEELAELQKRQREEAFERKKEDIIRRMNATDPRRHYQNSTGTASAAHPTGTPRPAGTGSTVRPTEPSRPAPAATTAHPTTPSYSSPAATATTRPAGGSAPSPTTAGNTPYTPKNIAFSVETPESHGARPQPREYSTVLDKGTPSGFTPEPPVTRPTTNPAHAGAKEFVFVQKPTPAPAAPRSAADSYAAAKNYEPVVTEFRTDEPKTAPVEETFRPYTPPAVQTVASPAEDIPERPTLKTERVMLDPTPAPVEDPTPARVTPEPVNVPTPEPAPMPQPEPAPMPDPEPEPEPVAAADDYDDADEPAYEEIPEEDLSDRPEEEETDDAEEISEEEQNPEILEQRRRFSFLDDTPASSYAGKPAEPEEDTPVDLPEEEPEEEDGEDDLPPFDDARNTADKFRERLNAMSGAHNAPAQKKPEEKEEHAYTPPDYSDYQFPPLEFLTPGSSENDPGMAEEIQSNADKLIDTLSSFNVAASIKGWDSGPRITRYEVVPARGVKVSAVTKLEADITLNLAAEGIRMEAPIPGKSAIGFEIPNKKPQTVRLRELIENPEFMEAHSKTYACIGKDVTGNPVYGDISRMPHMLVAGATGMGKSVCINAILLSILFRAKPDEVKFIMVDPKKVEFKGYNGIPHLLVPVVTEAKQAAGALMWACEEMDRRFDLIEKLNVKKIDDYNTKVRENPELGAPMSKIIIVIDELNDLMIQVRDPVENLIMRIAQKARAAGIHLIIGTQRPSVDVITGVIKANIPSRISCKVSSSMDSRTILDQPGAEKLLNNGDMLFWPVGRPKPLRVQGAFVSDGEMEQVMDFLRAQATGNDYDESVLDEINRAASKCSKSRDDDGDDEDDGSAGEGFLNDQKFLDAVELSLNAGKISTSLLQRKCGLGYGRAAKYIDIMEDLGIVSEKNGQKPRDVLITKADWTEMLARRELD